MKTDGRGMRKGIEKRIWRRTVSEAREAWRGEVHPQQDQTVRRV